MLDVLAACIMLDSKAHETYKTMAEYCSDPEIANVFRQLAIEEGVHVEWWTQLRDALAEGEVQAIGGTGEALARLREIDAVFNTIALSECSHWSCDDMLEVAVTCEFYMMDPLFHELLELVEQGGSHTVDAYDRHVYRLIELVERRYTRPGLGALLAGVLRRVYQDKQSLAKLATHDQQTGLLNRRGIMAQLDMWVAWSGRYHRTLGVMLLDLDHMKRINDTFGHQAGDEALIQTASALLGTVRDSDAVGRFGGDEFLVVAPEIGRDELAALMSRIASTLGASRFEGADAPTILAASVGGAWTDGRDAATSESLIALADRSLYTAKSEGRGRAAAVLGPHNAGHEA